LIARNYETAARRADGINDLSQALQAAKVAATATGSEFNPMWLTRLSKFDDANDLRTFKCQVCEHIETIVAKSTR
jgi:hypothetical protein